MRPLVFIHEGNQYYLKIAIQCAQEQGNEVYLIGDDSNKKFCNNWVAIDDLDSGAYEDFCKKYVHMSTNPYWFELICFRRFFLLYEFAKSNNFDEVILCDSDLLVYQNLSKYEYGMCDVALSYCAEQDEMKWTASAHCSFWKKESIKKFIDFFSDMYEFRQEKLLLKWNYHVQNKVNGGICDMTLLWLWIQEDTTIDVRNTTCADVEGNVFDHMVYSGNGNKLNQYKVNPKLKCKEIVFDCGIPFFVEEEKNSRVQALTIHAQGHSKQYMLSLYKKKNTLPTIFFSKLYHKFHGLFRKIHSIFK